MPKVDKQLKDDVLAEAKQVAIEMFTKSGTVPLAFLLVSARGRLVVQAASLPSDDAKDQISAGVRAFSRRRKALVVAMVCESWMVIETTDISPRDAMGRPPFVPSAHPDRIEAVVVSVESADGDAQVCYAQIVRDRPGDETSPGHLGAWTPLPPIMVGRFGGWFRAPEPKV
jgi:hypothetical protein